MKHGAPANHKISQQCLRDLLACHENIQKAHGQLNKYTTMNPLLLLCCSSALLSIVIHTSKRKLRIESHIGSSSFLQIEMCLCNPNDIHACPKFLTLLNWPSCPRWYTILGQMWGPESCISSICPPTNVLSNCWIPVGVLTFSKTSVCSHCVSGSKWHLKKLQQISFHALVTHTKLDDS
jgi:hypothetical protein